MLKKIGLLPNSLRVLTALVLISCELAGNKKPIDKTPKDTPFSPGSPPSSGIDFKKDCGIDPFDDLAAVVFSQKMKSLNIVYEGNVVLLSYRAEATVTLDIQSEISVTRFITDVKLNKVINKSTNSVVLSDTMLSIGSNIVAAVKTGTTELLSLSRKDWLQLSGGTNSEWKDLLCVAVGTRSVKTISKGGDHSFQFTPGFTNTLNPLASPEQYKRELGSGRTFNISATVDRDKQPIKGVVTYRPVPPSTTFTDAVTGSQHQITADAAWEVTTQFETKDSRFAELITKMTYYISHTRKQFDAIVQESASNGMMGSSVPTIVLLPAP